MPIATVCPLCSTKGQVPDSYSGKRVKCPQCCNLFLVGPAPASGSGAGKAAGNNGAFQRAGAKTQPEMVLPGPGANKPAGGPAVKKPGSSYQGTAKPTSGSNQGTNRATGSSHAGNTRPTAGSNPGTTRPTAGSNPGTTRPTGRSYSGRPAPKSPSRPNLDVRPKGNLPALLLGLFGFLLGIVGLTLSLVPDFEYLGWPISSAGVVFAFLGLALGVIRLRGCLMPLAGVLTSGGALALALLFSGTPKDKKNAEPTGKEQASLTSTKSEASGSSTTGSQRPPTTKKYVPPPPADEWTDASKGFARLGDVHVRVKGVEIGPVKGADGQTMGKQLSIQLQIENAGLSKKVNYRGAADPASRTGDAVPRLMDSSGGKYKPVAQGPPITGQLGKATIAPFMSVNDLLIFPPPPDGVQYLRLELPSAQFGAASGSVKIQIPGSMIVKKATLVASPKMIEKLREALRGRDRMARLDAVGKLGDAGAKAAPAVPELIQTLKDPDAALRAAAAQALGQIGPEARAALGELIALFQDTDETVAAKALEAVKRIEGAAAK